MCLSAQARPLLPWRPTARWCFPGRRPIPWARSHVPRAGPEGLGSGRSWGPTGKARDSNRDAAQVLRFPSPWLSQHEWAVGLHLDVHMCSGSARRRRRPSMMITAAIGRTATAHRRRRGPGRTANSNSEQPQAPSESQPCLSESPHRSDSAAGFTRRPVRSLLPARFSLI